MARGTRAVWARRVRQWKRSGLGAREFADREGLKPKSLWWWSWRLEREAPSRRRPSFVEVVPSLAAVADATGRAPVASSLEVVVGGGLVVVPVGFDEETLRRVLRVVGEG